MPYSRTVDEVDGLFDGVDPHGAEDGAEDLLPGDGHGRIHPVKERGAQEKTCSGRSARRPSQRSLRPFRLAPFDVPLDPLAVLLPDEGAHLGLGVKS